MKKILAASFCFCAMGAAQTALADLRVLANGGYQSLTFKDDHDNPGTTKTEMTGFAGSGRVQYDVFSPVPGLGVFVGGGIGQSVLGADKTIEGRKFKYAYKETYVPVEAGVQFSAIPMLRIQGAVQYHHALRGEMATTVPAPLTNPVDLKLDRASRVLLTGRAMLTVAPFVSAGLYGDVLASGKFKFKDQTEGDYDSGFEAGGVIALNF
jgi:hypothetical protein